jgi:tRNA (mo5U34)-methyltransferase
MQDDLRGQVARYRWYHSIDLGNGVVTPGRKSFATCTAEAHAIFGRVDLSGRTVLDVGAWNGFFSFEAKRRGAARVLATDSVAWTRPRDGMREPFDLARSVLGLDVEAREIDVAQLSTDSVGEFDIVLYLGVFYHRQDAIEALARVARLARQLLIVETHLDLRDIDRPAMAFYPGDELLGDKTNWWGPNERCMKALLHGHDFAEVEFAEHPGGPARGIFHAWRSTSARIEPLVEAAPPKPAPPKPAPPKPAPLNVRSKIIREIRRPFRRFFT